MILYTFQDQVLFFLHTAHAPLICFKTSNG